MVMSHQRGGLDAARRATVRICRRTGEHRGQGLLLNLDSYGAVVLTCHHVIAPLEEDDLFIQVPQEDGKLGSPLQARFDPERSQTEKDIVVLHVQGVQTGYTPRLYTLNPATYAGLLEAVGLTHLQPNNFNAQIGVSTPLIIRAPVPGRWGQPITEYRIPTAFRLAKATDAREGISGGVVLSEGGVVGLVHFARGESAETARECYLVPLSIWAEDWPELAAVLEPLPEPSAKWHGQSPANALAPFRRQFQAPPLPAHYVERVTEITQVVGGLLRKTPEQNGILVVSALHGLAGVGKTALAAATAHNPLINERFKDGILWTTLGQQPDPLANLVTWVHTLGDRDYSPSTTDAASSYLRTLLYTKNFLLVIDDVWESEHARPFLAGGPNCSVLITTRRAYVADDLGADLYALDVMTQADAVSLLKKRVETGRRGKPLTPADLEQAALLAQETGFLPLALDLMGALIARGHSWGEARRLLNLEQERRVGFKSRQHHAQLRLEASLQVSLNSLRAEDEKAWECFAWLGVIPDETFLNPSMAAKLWDVSEDEAYRLLSLLADEAIIQRAASRFSVHDLMHDMARQLLTSSIPDGLGLTMQHAHGLLLNRYASQIPGGDWSKLHDDGYIHSRLIWHIEQSGNEEAIHQLLCRSNDDSQNAWYIARDQLGQSAGYLEDIRTACRVNVNGEHFSIPRHCQYALITSSLHSLLQAISPQVLLILAEREIWGPEKVIDYIRQMSSSYDRKTALTGLFSVLSSRAQSPDLSTNPAAGGVWDIVLRETRNVVRDTPEDPEWGANILADLAHHFGGKLQAEIVQEAASLIRDSPDSLRRLSERVPSSYSKFVLEAACNLCAQIPDPIQRVKSLADIIPFLSAPAKSKWIGLMQQWTDELTEEPRSTASLNSGPDEVDTGRLAESTEKQTREEGGAPANLTSSASEEPHPAQKSNSLALILYEHEDVSGPAPRELDEDPRAQVLRHIFSKGLELPGDWMMKVIGRIPNFNPLIDAEYIDDAEYVEVETDPKLTEASRSLPDAAIEPDVAEMEFRLTLKHNPEIAIGLIPRLPAPRAPYVHQILENSGWYYEERRGEVLTRVANVLTAEERKQIATELIEKGRSSVGVMCVLATAEAEPTRTELFDSALTRLSNLPDHFDREAAMSSIARICPSHIVRRALAAYLRIDDVREQAGVIFTLTPNLGGELPAEVFDRLSDDSMNGKQIAILTRLVHQLSGAIKSGVLDEFMKEAASLSSEWWIVEALTLAILRVDDKSFFSLILDSAKNISLPDLHSRLVGRIMLRLARLGHVKEALAAVDTAPQRDRWGILADLSIELAKDGLLSEAEEIARTIYNSEERSKAYATIAIYHAARGNVEEARLIANTITSKQWRQWIDSRLSTLEGVEVIPLLSESARPISGSVPTPSGEVKFESICEVVNGILQRGIECNELHEILAKAKANNAEETTRSVRRFWQAKIDGERTYLDIISQQPRHLFLKEIQKMRPLLNISLTEEEARDMILAIQRVSSWWP